MPDQSNPAAAVAGGLDLTAIVVMQIRTVISAAPSGESLHALLKILNPAFS